MGKIELLYELQGIDLQIDDAKKRLSQIESQLGESQALLQARQLVEATKQNLYQALTRQRELEWDVEDTDRKVKALEKKLYGGTVHNPKELASMQREVEILKAQRRSIEDALLDTMARSEELQAAANEGTEKLDTIEADWKREQEQLREAQSQVKAQLAELGQTKETLKGRVDPPTLKVYEQLRLNKSGLAVSRVEQNTCQGCHISLPIHLVHKVRTSPDPMFCPNCGRFLYAPK